MINNPVPYSEHSRTQRGSARQAWNIRCVHVAKQHTITCEGINVRSGITVVASAPQMIRTQRININVNNSHPLFVVAE